MALAAQVRGEEIRALFRQGTAVLCANVAVGAIVSATLWSRSGRSELAAWFGAIVLITLLRWWLLRAYRRARPAAGELPAWGTRFVLGSSAAGLLWGCAGFAFFDPGSASSQALLTFAVGGMTAAAAGTLACHLRAFSAFFFLALGPLSLRTLAEGDSLHIGMGAMLLAYGAGLLYVARNNHRSFTRAFLLGLENAALVEQLSRSQQELEQRVNDRTAQLEHRSEALKRAQRLEVVGKLAGSLAHDFNNLLTVVLSNTAMLADGKASDEQRHAAAEETLQAARRGAGLIRQLLSLTHRQRTEPRVFSLNELVSSSSSVLRRLAGDGIATSIELGPGPGLVHADPAQMEQVLMNLASAASAAMPDGGKLHIRTSSDESYVALSVEDDSGLRGGPAGAGSLPRRADSAFDHFPSSAAEAFDRSLGLSAARAIIEEMGGRFLVDSSSSGGTHFRVELPVSHQEPAPPQVSFAAKGPKHATLLVVDDEPSLRAVMRRTLARQGYEILVAEDGERALQLSRQRSTSIDLLITDVIMPGLSGPDLARRLLAERPGMGVLFISGYSFEESIPATDVAQGTGYLAKPFDASTLNSKVRLLLGAVSERSGVRDVG